MGEVYGAGAIGSGKPPYVQLHGAVLISDGQQTAMAANGNLRYIFGATFPLFTIQMYQNLGIHWAGSLFAFLSLGLLPIPWLLFIFGPRLRALSRFTRASEKSVMI